MELRYDITGIYRGSNTNTNGYNKPYDEFGIWAYHPDPKTITISPGTIEAILTGDNTFYVIRQTWGGDPNKYDLTEGTGFVKDSLMEMKLVLRLRGDTVNAPELFTFRGFRPTGN